MKYKYWYTTFSSYEEMVTYLNGTDWELVSHDICVKLTEVIFSIIIRKAA